MLWEFMSRCCGLSSLSCRYCENMDAVQHMYVLNQVQVTNCLEFCCREASQVVAPHPPPRTTTRQPNRLLAFCLLAYLPACLPACLPAQVLGGASFVRGGKGVLLERIVREVRVATVGGGSEEIMLDLAGRQAKL